MEIRCINDFRLPFIDPNFLKDGLTVGTVAVPAGVVVDGDMSTVLAGGDGATHRGRFTVQDGTGSLELHR